MTPEVQEAMASSTAAGGFWWCRHCRRVTALLDPDHGESGSRCERCRSLKIEFKSYAPEPAPARARQVLHRLPVERRDLRLLAREGYFFCFECSNVTDETKAGTCVLCGSGKVEWQEPAGIGEVAA